MTLDDLTEDERESLAKFGSMPPEYRTAWLTAPTSLMLSVASSACARRLAALLNQRARPTAGTMRDNQQL